MNENKKIEVIIVGAGPSGVAAAITIARAGKKVLVVERGNFAGSKNVFGGAIYIEPTEEIFPDFLKTAPIERINSEHKFALLTENDATVISYKNEENSPNSCTVLRAKFDRWCVEQAKIAGAFFAPNTTVRELIVENEKIVGIKTDFEDYYADIVILADGVNSLLAKQIGLRKNINPIDVALAVKEVLKLNKEKLEDRFNLNETSGCVYEFLGYPMENVMGLGFAYTNKDTISIGVGIGLEDLKSKNLNANDLLNKLKSHPLVAPLIKTAETVEYSAHLIPEGGFNKMPKMYANGVMVVGDAAMLVNNLHWEGTNLALKSGKLAGETAVQALNNQDFSENQLSLYQHKLESSYIVKDLKTYKNVLHDLNPQLSSFFGYYPQKASEFFKMFTAVNGKPKREEFRNYIKSWFTDRSIKCLFDDVWCLIKTAWGVLK